MARTFGSKNTRPTAEEKSVATLAAIAKYDRLDDASFNLAVKNQTPNINKVTDLTMEEVIVRVACGETLRSVCRELGVSSALVRQRVVDQHELYADRMREARSMNADECFEEMIEVARDPEMSPAQKRILIDTLRDIARINDRSRYGDKVQIDQRQVVINLDERSLRL